MEAPPASRIGSAGSRRRLFFGLVTALVAIVGLELGARVVELGYHLITGEDETPFVRWRHPARVFQIVDYPQGSLYQRTQDHWILWSDFPVEKTPDRFRVFCLGGSAAMGWPHWADHSYPGILEQKLAELYPERSFDVENVAGNTYGSHRVKLVFDEIIDYEPDLVLIYSGNNEFLETFVYAPHDVPLQSLALGRILRRVLSPQPTLDVGDYGMADQVVNRVSFAFGRESRLREDPQQFAEVLAHYRFNIETMVETARRRGVAVMLLTVPVNLKDWVPNVSRHRADLSEEERARFQEHFREGVLALEADAPERAERALRSALALDATWAEAHFRLGTALRLQGRLEEARRAYEEAVALDAYPFRALPQFREILEDVAERHHVPLVDAAGAVARRAGDGIPGYDALVDYVHPTVASNEAIAHEVLGAILAEGLLPPRPPEAVAATRREIELDPQEALLALRGVYGQLLIMRQYDRLPVVAEQAFEVARRAGDDSPEARSFVVHVEQTQAVIEPYRRLLRDEKLGTVAAEFTPEEAEATFRAYVDLVRRLEASRMPEQEFRALLPESPAGARGEAPPPGVGKG